MVYFGVAKIFIRQIAQRGDGFWDLDLTLPDGFKQAPQPLLVDWVTSKVESRLSIASGLNETVGSGLFAISVCYS